MSFPLMAATAALVCAALPAVADTVVWARATFQNATERAGLGRDSDPNGPVAGNRVFPVPARSAYTAPDLELSVDAVVLARQRNFAIVLEDGRACRAGYLIYRDTCSRLGVSSEGGAICDSVPTWSGSVCHVSLEIKE